MEDVGLDGRAREVEFRPEGTTIEVGSEVRVLDTWIRELPVDRTGVRAVTLEGGLDADGSVGRLVSRMREMVSE